MQAAREAFPDFHITVDGLIEDGDRVAGRITMTGTNTGALLAMAPTGRTVSVTGMFIRHLRDSRFVAGWDLIDTAALMRQLGHAQEPAPTA